MSEAKRSSNKQSNDGTHLTIWPDVGHLGSSRRVVGPNLFDASLAAGSKHFRLTTRNAISPAMHSPALRWIQARR